MSDYELKLFGASDTPDYISGWKLYEKAQMFNNGINLDDCVKANENFYIGM